MQSELKPCPFCGGVPHLMHCGAGTYMIQCLQCKATTDDGGVERISGNWNRRAALSEQEPPESEWHRVDRSAASVLLYTLREEGWRRGEPVMVNDVMINIDRGSGSSTDIEPIVQRIRSALSTRTASSAHGSATSSKGSVE